MNGQNKIEIDRSVRLVMIYVITDIEYFLRKNLEMRSKMNRGKYIVYN
jgi:hypothetical protein